MGSVLSEKVPLQRVPPSTQQEAAAVQTLGLMGEKLEGALGALSQRAAQPSSSWAKADLDTLMPVGFPFPIAWEVHSKTKSSWSYLLTYLVIYFTDSFYFGGIWGAVVSFEAAWEYLHRSHNWALRL